METYVRFKITVKVSLDMIIVEHRLWDFLASKGLSMSRTTSYNPAGQVEKYNGTKWKALTMCLKSKALPTEYWQDAFPDVLHSVRSLLWTATKETPHERFFGFVRRSSTGISTPSWLAAPGPVYVKRNVRNRKTEPLEDEAELLQANSHYRPVFAILMAEKQQCQQKGLHPKDSLQ